MNGNDVRDILAISRVVKKENRNMKTLWNDEIHVWCGFCASWKGSFSAPNNYKEYLDNIRKLDRDHQTSEKHRDTVKEAELNIRRSQGFID